MIPTSAAFTSNGIISHYLEFGDLGSVIFRDLGCGEHNKYIFQCHYFNKLI